MGQLINLVDIYYNKQTRYAKIKPTKKEAAQFQKLSEIAAYDDKLINELVLEIEIPQE